MAGVEEIHVHSPDTPLHNLYIALAAAITWNFTGCAWESVSYVVRAGFHRGIGHTALVPVVYVVVVVAFYYSWLKSFTLIWGFVVDFGLWGLWE